MGEAAIEVRDLRKSYGDVEAVAGLDLTVSRGEVVALLGPNGAGKTTTVEILEGHRDRDGGDVSVLGHDPAARSLDLRRRIGIVLQTTGIEPYLTVAETIEQFRGFYPSPRPLDEVLEAVELTDLRDRRVKRLSGGQQRRLDVAVGLAGDPDLLFLDEPTTGFDPSARRGAWDMIRNLRALGKTVLLTTHYMDEAQSLADRVAIVVRGRIVAEGPPAILTGRDRHATISFRDSGDGLPVEVGEAEVEGGMVRIRTEEPTRVLHTLTSWATARGEELAELTVSRPSLEDVYLELTEAEG
ncbi:MAG TPA: ABC transporter ATP-binding protein [Actinomycetota bacterium]|nr:ABC transporter ATP-binding protein [Actinomycetota bacterium]